ncbi:DUF2218 domain-containing protein [Nocardioides ultimimeridianus]
MRSIGFSATDRAARYGKQLASHLGRKHGSTWSEDEERGTITFGEGGAELVATPEGLEIVVTGPDLDTLEDVVGRHLVRFGEKDELTIAWTREDA